MNILTPLFTHLEQKLEQQSKFIDETKGLLIQEINTNPQATQPHNQEQLNEIHRVYVSIIEKGVQNLGQQAELGRALLEKMKARPIVVENFLSLMNETQSEQQKLLEAWKGIQKEILSTQSQILKIGVHSFTPLQLDPAA